MTESASNISLSRDQLRKVLAAAKNNAPVEENDIEVFNYDWRRPRQFNDTHHMMFAEFCKQLAGDLAEKFSELCNDPSRVTIPRVKEYYCEGIKKEFCEEKKNYYLVFADERNREVGVMIFAHLSAIEFTAKMLGDTNPEVSEDYEITNLEESLLIELGDTVISKFSDSLIKHELPGVRSLSVLSDRDWPLDCLDYEEFTYLQLQVEQSESNVEAALVISSSYFGPMLGITFPDGNETSDQQVRDAIISNLHKIPLEVDVLLGKAVVAFSDLMTLRKGDVLVLDRKAGEPAEALIEERVFFHGFPAKVSNRFALAVSDMVEPRDILSS